VLYGLHYPNPRCVRYEGLGALMMLWLVSAAMACPSLSEAVERMALAVVAGSDPTAPRADISASLQCAPASQAELARWYLAEGAFAFLNQDPAAARWFVASRRLAPDGFDERYGALVKTAWQSAVPEGTARLTVDLAASIDGKPVDAWPFSLEAGPVVVQVIGADGSVRYFRSVELAADEEVLLPTMLGPEGAKTVATRKKKAPTMLIVGGTSAVLAGVAAGLAVNAAAEIDAAPDVGTLEAASQQQKAFAYGAYGLGGLALASVGLYFVLP
jgi:hypothetical protein